LWGRRKGPRFVYFVLLLTLYYLCSSIALLASIRRRHRRPSAPAGLCFKCRYELAGLRSGVPCPECGARDVVRQWPRILMVHPARMKQWVFTLIGVLMCTMLSWPLAFALLWIAYQVEGFSATQAMHCIPLRELGPHDSALVNEVVPFLVSVAAAPLLILMMPARMVRRSIVGLWFLGIVGSAVQVVWFG